MTRSTERPPVRAGSGRRPIAPLIVLLVLAIVALGVWWNVFRNEASRAEAKAAACSTAAQAPPSLDPATLTVNVINGTDRAGLAGTVATTLTSRGFTVENVESDRSGAAVTGVGELRFGPRGRENAEYLRLYLPGATDRPDTRATAVVDVVLGPDFAELSTPEQIAASLATAAATAASCTAVDTQ
jgi:hypothetical protein